MLLPEDELLRRLLAGEENAMTGFYRQYHAALYATVLKIVRNRHSAEDVLQEALLKVWLSAASYDAARGRLFTWAARICANAAIDHVRSSHFRMTARTASLEHSPALGHAAPVEFRPEHIGVADLLYQLRPEHRQVLDLLYLQGFTQAEAAAALNLPLGTLKTRAASAKRRLAQLPQ